MLQVGDRIHVKIESVAFGGDGVGRMDHRVVFVPFAAEGDELEVVVTQIKKRFLRGQIVTILTPSPFREEPRCSHYGRCGGCCYQHLNYPYQLSIKKKQVVDVLNKIGKIAHPPVSEVVASPQCYHYRGKAQVHLEATSGGWQAGFLDVSGATLLGIDACAIMDESINDQLRDLKSNRTVWNKKSTRLTLWSKSESQKTQDGKTIVRRVKNKKFLVPAGGFFQTNLYLTDRLVDEVCRMVVDEKTDTIVDAYCGCGLFSVFLSSHTRKIFGIERDAMSVAFARQNAKELGVCNAQFICGDVSSVLKKHFLSAGEKMDVLILDPPRSGCSKIMLDTVAQLKPQKIIYISCNPATQARDVQYLAVHGYVLRSLVPLDMFPQTQHVEVVGYLEWTGHKKNA